MSQEDEYRIPCPTCGEKILASARKCRYCGEWLDENGSTFEKKKKPRTLGELWRSSAVWVRRLIVAVPAVPLIVMFSHAFLKNDGWILLAGYASVFLVVTLANAVRESVFAEIVLICIIGIANMVLLSDEISTNRMLFLTMIIQPVMTGMYLVTLSIRSRFGIAKIAGVGLAYFVAFILDIGVGIANPTFDPADSLDQGYAFFVISLQLAALPLIAKFSKNLAEKLPFEARPVAPVENDSRPSKSIVTKTLAAAFWGVTLLMIGLFAWETISGPKNSSNQQVDAEPQEVVSQQVDAGEQLCKMLEQQTPIFACMPMAWPDNGQKAIPTGTPTLGVIVRNEDETNADAMAVKLFMLASKIAWLPQSSEPALRYAGLTNFHATGVGKSLWDLELLRRCQKVDENSQNLRDSINYCLSTYKPFLGTW